MSDMNVIEVVGLPQPVIFGCIVDEEVDVGGYFGRLNGGQISAYDFGLWEEGRCALEK